MSKYSMVKRRKSWESRAERERRRDGVGSEGVMRRGFFTLTKLPMFVVVSLSLSLCSAVNLNFSFGFVVDDLYEDEDEEDD